MKINAIEGLRALLAWWVVLNHIFQLTGFIRSENKWMMLSLNASFAVDIFIIISGFVIFYLLDRRKEPYKPYIVRRLFRIYPLFIFSVIVGLLTMSLKFENIAISDGMLSELDCRLDQMTLHSNHVVKYLMPVLFMVHGCIPQSMMPYASTAFNGPIWSISLEMQFYVIAPLILAALLSSKKRLWASLCLAFFGTFPGFFVKTELGAFFTEHLNWFILGWISYFLYTFFEKHQEILKKIPVSIGLIALALIGLYFGREINHFLRPKDAPMLPMFLPLLLWLVFFGFLIDNLKNCECAATKVFRYCFENKVIMNLGKTSYSIYLLHVPIINVVVNFILKNHLASDRWQLFFLTSVIASPIIVIASQLSYKYIEVPGIKLGSKIAKNLGNA
jgi:peptidoglycan/LPS O-acetylase OafA/YrhL